MEIESNLEREGCFGNAVSGDTDECVIHGFTVQRIFQFFSDTFVQHPKARNLCDFGSLVSNLSSILISSSFLVFARHESQVRSQHRGWRIPPDVPTS